MADAPTNPAVQPSSRSCATLWASQPRGRKAARDRASCSASPAIVACVDAAPPHRWLGSRRRRPLARRRQELIVALAEPRRAGRLTTGKVEVAERQGRRGARDRRERRACRTPASASSCSTTEPRPSSFVEQVNYRRALQGELARTHHGARAGRERPRPPRDRQALALQGSGRAGRRRRSRCTSTPARRSRRIRCAACASSSRRASRASRPSGRRSSTTTATCSTPPMPSAADRKRARSSAPSPRRVRSMLERVVGAGKVVGRHHRRDRRSRRSARPRSCSTTSTGAAQRGAHVEGADAARAASAASPARAATCPARPPRRRPARGAARAPAAPAGDQELRGQPHRAADRQARRRSSRSCTSRSSSTTRPAPTASRSRAPTRSSAELAALAREAAGIDDARGDKIEVRSIPFVARRRRRRRAAAAAAPAAALPLPSADRDRRRRALLARDRRGGRAARCAARRTPQALDDRRPLALPAPVGELERVLDARPTTARARLAGGTAPAPAARPQSLRDRVLEAVRADVDRAAGVLTAWLVEAPAQPRQAHPKGAIAR